MLKIKIVNIIGGIGNQMFQYAFALSLKKHFPEEEILIDTSHFNGYGLHNGFEIDRVFGAELRVASGKELRKVTYYTPNYKISRLLRKYLGYKKTEYKEPRLFTYWGDEIYLRLGDTYFEGSWQNEKYFENCKDDIVRAFHFRGSISKRNQVIFNKLMSENSIGIHVRRGDYLQEDSYKNICDLPYYQNAIAYIKDLFNDASFYIFSNDSKWCRENLLPLCGNATVVDWNSGSDSWVDMMLLSNCKHNIIAHSSFSWWAAWLNQNHNKVVISPTGWFNKEGITDSPQLPNWVKLDNK